MKKLLLLRHGKAEIGDYQTDDFDRCLNDRGKKNAFDMGVYIAQHIHQIDLVLSSDASRTTQTAILLSENINYPKEKIVFDSNLYLASLRRLLKTIYALSNDCNTCLLVGHNPGISDLVNFLGVRLDNLPTASSVCFTFDTNNWSEISEKNSKLHWIKFSKDL